MNTYAKSLKLVKKRLANSTGKLCM